MHSRHESLTPLTINPYIFWILGLSFLLGAMIFFVPPNSLFIISLACFLAGCVQYASFALYVSKKTSLFNALCVWVGILLYLLSAFTGMNIVIFCALIAALGIYLYR